MKLPYVGTLAANDSVLLKQGPQRLDEFAAHLKEEQQAAVARARPPVFKPITIRYKGTKEPYFSYRATNRLPSAIG